MNPYYVGGAMVGGFLGQILIYQLLVWLGGKHHAHPYRQIIGFNLFIFVLAIAADAAGGASTPILVRAWICLAVILTVITYQRYYSKGS